MSDARTPPMAESGRAGSGSAPATPRGARAGPEARISTGTEPDVPCPPSTKPAIRAFPPVPTPARHDTSASRPASAAVLTASAAAPLAAELPKLVATHAYDPALAAVAPLTTSVEPVAPEPVAPSDSGLPLNSHRYVCAEPVATALKTTVSPAAIVCEAGCVVKTAANGPAATALVPMAEPAEFMATTWTSFSGPGT